MPRTGLMTRPNLMIWSTLLRTMSTGMANPTPLLAPLGEYIAVLMPASKPSVFSHLHRPKEDARQAQLGTYSSNQLSPTSLVLSYVGPPSCVQAAM